MQTSSPEENSLYTKKFSRMYNTPPQPRCPCYLDVSGMLGRSARTKKENLHIGGEMDYKKIQINESAYVKLFDDDRFEVHCSATGPLGAEVYSFKRGYLEWRQRRSYSFVSKRYKVTYE